ALVGAVAERIERLRGDDHLVAAGQLVERPPDNLFADAARVHVGGVEEVDAVLERADEERAAGGLVEDPRPPLRRAIGHRPETDARDLQARATEPNVIHRRRRRGGPFVSSVSPLCPCSYFTSRSSTSNSSVALGGIAPPAPRWPYPSSDGMTSVRVPPTFIPATPWSQPRMTCPPPSLNENGSPWSFELSNFLPCLSAAFGSYSHPV